MINEEYNFNVYNINEKCSGGNLCYDFSPILNFLNEKPT